MTTVIASSFLLVVFHVFFVVVVASQSGSGAVSSDERRFLLRNARLALLDGQTLVGPPLDLDFLGRLGGSHGISSDGGVSIAIHLLQAVGSDAVLHELTELLLVSLLILLQERLHVVGDVLSEDVVLVHFRIVFFAFCVEPGEAFIGVGDVDAAVDGTLESTEDLGAGRRAGEANIEVGAEGAVLSIYVLHAEVLAIGISLAFVDFVETVLGQDSPGDQEAGAVGGGIVGQPDLDAVFGEFVSVSGLDDHVSVNTGVRYLTDDVLVGKSNDQSVLGSVVLVLILADKASSGKVVGFALATALVFDLEPLEVGLVFDNFDESHDSFGYGVNATRRQRLYETLLSN